MKANVGGQQQNLSDTIRGMTMALGLSLLLVYLLMVALYDSLPAPFIIMFSVPVAAVGALTSLAITHQALNLFSLIGTVLLVGLASKNGILLVDFANHMVERGMSRGDAMIEAARERFRPIVMTTCAMIAGMTPIALALDPGAGQRQALGIVVIGGLISSLLLTLRAGAGDVHVAGTQTAQRRRAGEAGVSGTRVRGRGELAYVVDAALRKTADAGDGLPFASTAGGERRPASAW